MTDAATLLQDLKGQLRLLEDDLRTTAEDESTEWGTSLRRDYQRARDRGRTGQAWSIWRDGEVSQAGVAWIISTVFVRFVEDNDLLRGAKLEGRLVAQPWIAAPGDGLDRAAENEGLFYAAEPTRTSRGWLLQAFTVLQGQPAGRALVDPDHSPVWRAPISASATDELLVFFRRTNPDGSLVHDFQSERLDTRFLGDLYQDLSEYAKKTYALLQTPEFVEEFILDHTLTPAIAEFGLTGLKLIDPACGSGHFLLGAFDRLVEEWRKAAPGLDRGERVRRALDSIHGVDLNPFAIAIARFRLTVAALRAAGLSALTDAPKFDYHLAIGDSLLGSTEPDPQFNLGDDEYFEYDTEDLREYQNILQGDQYHVVVANPPYIQPPDARLRDKYRELYKTCHGKYALSVPFMELLFRLAKRPNGGGAGYVGQITSNAFMKREFGKKLIEQFLSGKYTGPEVKPDYVELSHIVDTSGAYIPGHGTPTVILIGRPRRPQSDTVRAVLGVRGEPGQPADPANGLVWRDIVDHLEEAGYDGPFVSVADMPRSSYATFPWSLSGGGVGGLRERIEQSSSEQLERKLSMPIGFASFPGNDSPYFLDAAWFHRHPDSREYGKPLVLGEYVRDWGVNPGIVALAPRMKNSSPAPFDVSSSWGRHLWRFRTSLRLIKGFGEETLAVVGAPWWAWYRWVSERYSTPLSITFAFVATHNHFVLDRGGKVFKQSAPVIKLPEGATEQDHYELLGVLNSSVACFWLKQVSHNKGDSTDSRGARVTGDPAFDTYEFTGTKLWEFPLPTDRAADLAQRIDEAARVRAAVSPSAVLEEGETSDLTDAETEWTRLGREMVALQEELDWRMYVAYGLADTDLAPTGRDLVPISPNERVFEIKLAREVAAGTTQTSWFGRHGRTPLTDLPGGWPSWYRDLSERRLAAIANDKSLRLLEQPEYKRRWAGPTWHDLVADAVQTALLDRLESPDLWQDASGRPVVRSAAQIADALRHDARFRDLLVVHTWSRDYDLVVQISDLLKLSAVPAFAPLRYKPAGLEKFHVWQHTWDLQRAEDRGEQVDIPVPPKYTKTDFRRGEYWTARGKLDVPKERFIAFPGSHYSEDDTATYGWAGWDHAERGQAIARFANDLARGAAPDEQIVPLVGALIELEPWLKQWHDEIGPSGVSPATAIEGVISAVLRRLEIGPDTVLAWRPPAPRRGRGKKKQA